MAVANITAIKVQMPLDRDKVLATGNVMVDLSPDAFMLAYSEGGTPQIIPPSAEPEVYRLMVEGFEGVPYYKAFLYGHWDDRLNKYVFDLDRGFAPIYSW